MLPYEFPNMLLLWGHGCPEWQLTLWAGEA